MIILRIGKDGWMSLECQSEKDILTVGVAKNEAAVDFMIDHHIAPHLYVLGVMGHPRSDISPENEPGRIPQRLD